MIDYDFIGSTFFVTIIMKIFLYIINLLIKILIRFVCNKFEVIKNWKKEPCSITMMTAVSMKKRTSEPKEMNIYKEKPHLPIKLIPTHHTTSSPLSWTTV